MSTDSPPGSHRPAAGGEFTWPPTREELDAIEVIPLDDASSARPIAVVPAKAIAAPAITRRGRLRLPLRLPRREDLVFSGVICTSVLAIAVAASMQFSDLWRAAPPEPAVESIQAEQAMQAVQSERPDRPLAPLIAQALPLMSPMAAAPIATFTSDASPASPAAAPSVVVNTRSRLAPRAMDRRRAPSRSAVSARSARAETSTRRAAMVAPSTRPSRDDDYARPRLISPESGRNGKLVLLVEVRKNGKVGDVDVLSSNLDRDNRSHRDLQRAAVSTVKRWRYTPAMRDGHPADTQIRVVVDINLASARVAFTEANARRRAAAAGRAADTFLAAR